MTAQGNGDHEDLKLTMKYNGALVRTRRRVAADLTTGGRLRPKASMHHSSSCSRSGSARESALVLGVDVIGASDGLLDHERRARRDIPNHPGSVR
jgi:hypothetical protein